MKALSFRSLIPFIVILFAVLFCGSALAQSHGFTYQGRLSDGGAPANGAYDLRFRLLDALSGGNQVGSTIDVADVPVVGGVFNATVDFGASAFDGIDRWLEVSVRPGASTGIYALLTPNVQITPTPYATQLLPGTGTIKFGAGSTPLLIHTPTCCNTGNRMIWAHSPLYPDWGIYYDDTPDIMHWRQAAGAEVFTVDMFRRRVGVGNSAPAQPLDVTGNIQFSGQLLSTLPNGAPPFIVQSTTSVANLNADFLDGIDSSLFATKTTNTFVGNQNVTGNITATGSITAGTTVSANAFSIPATTRYLSLPCAAFIPDINSMGYLRCSGQGDSYGTTAGIAAFDSPVLLPHGATITKVEGIVKDNSAAQNIEMYLFKMGELGGFNLITSASSSGTPGTTTLSSSISHTVDNSSGAYHLRFYYTVPATPSDISFFHARITYTVTSLLP